MTGILVPSGTPAAVIDLLNLEVTKALSDPEVKSQLTTLGMDIVGSSLPSLNRASRQSCPDGPA